MNGYCLFLAVMYLASGSDAGHIWTSSRNSNFCFWTSSISNGQTHYMFLHQITAGKERSFVLFDSIWDQENSLVDCVTSNSHAVIKSFLSKCWKATDRDRPFSDIPDGRFSVSVLVEPDGPCVAVGHLPELKVPVRRTRDLQSVDHRIISQNSGEDSQKLKRSKRAWMIPGTLWCGSGNKASTFSDLGLFEETDKCCREHDHCDQTISSFEFGYGVFNTNFFTLSHCDCDSKFRKCLRDANDNMSDMVGYGFFNVLKMRCFEFSQRMECAERTWWGMCKYSQMTTYAILKDATDYNSTAPVLEADKLDLSMHHTISFGDLKVANDLVMSSDIATEDAREKHSSVSVQQRPAVTVNTSQQPELHGQTTESLKTYTADTTMETTYSPQTEKTDLSITETDSPKTKTTESFLIETTESKTETTDTEIEIDTFKAATTDSQMTQTIESPKTETTDSSNMEATDSKPQTVLPQLKTTDSPQTKTTYSPQTETTDSTQTETTDSPQTETTNSPVTKTTDSPQTETTDLPQTIPTYSPQTEARDLPQTETTDLPKTETTDPPQTETTDSPKTEARDLPKPEITQSTNTETSDSPKTEARDLPKPEITQSTNTETTHPPQTKLTESKPQINAPKTETTDSPKMQQTYTSKPQTGSPKIHIHPEMQTKQKGKPDTCESYKDLDSCRYQIPALQEKFGLRNAEHTTLYHCDCTARLARELAEEDEVDKVHFWLLDLVSQSCFYLPQNCTGSESCSTSSSNDAPLIERWINGADVWRHLAAPRRKSKRFNAKRSKRKDSPIKLHRKCVRLQSRLQKRAERLSGKEGRQLDSI